jgi:hypothetical protein
MRGVGCINGADFAKDAPVKDIYFAGEIAKPCQSHKTSLWAKRYKIVRSGTEIV